MSSSRFFAFATAVSLAVFALATASAEAAPATKPAAGEPALLPLTPAMEAAMAGLADDDYKVREAGLAKLEGALGEQVGTLVASDKPESRAQIIAALQFQDGLARFLLDASKLPADERKSQIAFAFMPGILPMVAQAYSPNPVARTEGVRKLSTIDRPESTALLGRMLTDPDRAVYIAAMEALWDRTPTDAIIDALWDRAVDASLANYLGQATRVETVTFRGRAIPAQVYPDDTPSRRLQDNAVACELLVHFKSPRVREKLKTLVESAGGSSDGTQSSSYLWQFSMTSPPMDNVLQLIESDKSPEILGALYKVAISPSSMSSQGQLRTEKFFYTNRTTLLATVITLTGQKPAAYGIKQLNGRSGMWTTSAQEDEAKAVEKLKTWWTANAGKAATQSPETQPLTAPAQHASKPLPTGP